MIIHKWNFFNQIGLVSKSKIEKLDDAYSEVQKTLVFKKHKKEEETCPETKVKVIFYNIYKYIFIASSCLTEIYF